MSGRRVAIGGSVGLGVKRVWGKWLRLISRKTSLITRVRSYEFLLESRQIEREPHAVHLCILLFLQSPARKLIFIICFGPFGSSDRSSLWASFGSWSSCHGVRYEVCVLVYYICFAGNVNNLPRVPLRSCMQLFHFGRYLSSGYIFFCRGCSYNGSWVIYFYHSSTSYFTSLSHSIWVTPLWLARTSMRAALAYKRYNVGIRWGARSITCVAFLRL